MVLLAMCVVTGGLVSYLHKSADAKQQKIQRAQFELAMIRQALAFHFTEWNRHPDTSMSASEILTMLKTPIRGGGPLLLNLWQGKEEAPKDPWGRDYCMLPRGGMVHPSSTRLDRTERMNKVMRAPMMSLTRSARAHSTHKAREPCFEALFTAHTALACVPERPTLGAPQKAPKHEQPRQTLHSRTR